MAETVAFAAPRTEEMTKTITGLAGAGISGIAEGVIVRMAPQMGAAAPILTWGTLLGVPLVGVAGALFTRGMLGDLFQGIAAGGIGILGYSLPALIAPVERRAPTPTGQLGVGNNVKLLGAGVADAATIAARAAGARVGIEF